ncbi:MAG: hypothetical protein F6K42_25555, partial [Leptolyngbya sp. SIO1D8]|nr:hypothetical protein [Leptolyngbya sp. SIO1D8]
RPSSTIGALLEGIIIIISGLSCAQVMPGTTSQILAIIAIPATQASFSLEVQLATKVASQIDVQSSQQDPCTWMSDTRSQFPSPFGAAKPTALLRTS